MPMERRYRQMRRRHQCARTVYEVRIRQGIMYQQHPCFAKTENGEWRLPQLNEIRGQGI